MPLAKETLQYRKDNDLCARCGNPNESGKSLCRKHLDQFAQKAARRRKKLTSLGKCQQCQRDLDRDTVICTICSDKQKPIQKKAQKKRYNRRRSAGLCVGCENPAMPNQTRCEDCAQLDAEKQKTRREHRIANNLCIVCGEYLGENPSIQMCDKHSKKRSEWYVGSDVRKNDRVRRIERKKLVLAHYGGKCVECGEDGWAKLAIDHINNDGSKHRKELRESGSTYYKWLIDNNFPDEFQILCHNCNWQKYYDFKE
ncbi:hypothetical protein LCGC14_2679080 [marine sediment metagenome]|uniref:HNH nuclease domain-containing protein n=1 Tax=marine sediment metagenome TaxID=412755 RepID=A0A0F8ZLV2_9ZZZZ